jgi:hypothetical protein
MIPVLDIALHPVRTGNHRAKLVTSKLLPTEAYAQMRIQNWSTIDELFNGGYHNNYGEQYYQPGEPPDDIQ